jgi:hypothetical protein
VPRAERPALFEHAPRALRVVRFRTDYSNSSSMVGATFKGFAVFMLR